MYWLPNVEKYGRNGHSLVTDELLSPISIPLGIISTMLVIRLWRTKTCAWRCESSRRNFRISFADGIFCKHFNSLVLGHWSTWCSPLSCLGILRNKSEASKGFRNQRRVPKTRLSAITDSGYNGRFPVDRVGKLRGNPDVIPKCRDFDKEDTTVVLPVSMFSASVAVRAIRASRRVRTLLHWITWAGTRSGDRVGELRGKPDVFT